VAAPTEPPAVAPPSSSVPAAPTPESPPPAAAPPPATASASTPAPGARSGTAGKTTQPNTAPSAHPAPPTSAPATPPATSSRSAPAAPPAALDLTALEQRLRDTRAIGVFTKLSLKNQVDDLLAQFKAFHAGHSQFTLAQLRQKYEVLLMKVVSLLQDGDPGLASAVSSSREAIWNVLTDPTKLANI
jgi:hypothetical protein